MRSKYSLSAATAVALILAATATNAGQRTIHEVTIYDDTREAGGSFVDARGSDDRSQAIGCFINIYRPFAGGPGQGAELAFCWAVDANNVFRSCSTRDPRQLELISSLNSESFLAFRWDQIGHCEAIYVRHVSSGKPATLTGR
jgi:hypothetical protein